MKNTDTMVKHFNQYSTSYGNAAQTIQGVVDGMQSKYNRLSIIVKRIKKLMR